MTLEEALVSHLEVDAGVSALVGTRIYPLVVPQDADLPAIAYQRISGPREYALDGHTGAARARVQVTSVAESYSGAKALSVAVRAAMRSFRGVGDLRVEAVFEENEVDSWQDRFNAPVVMQDFMIRYQEL